MTAKLPGHERGRRQALRDIAACAETKGLLPFSLPGIGRFRDQADPRRAVPRDARMPVRSQGDHSGMAAG
jgi:hypothetical protein